MITCFTAARTRHHNVIKNYERCKLKIKIWEAMIFAIGKNWDENKPQNRCGPRKEGGSLGSSKTSGVNTNLVHKKLNLRQRLLIRQTLAEVRLYDLRTSCINLILNFENMYKYGVYEDVNYNNNINVAGKLLKHIFANTSPVFRGYF